MAVNRNPWVAAVAIAFVGLPAFAQSAADTYSSVVSADGAIHVPENYQEEMVFIGAWGIKGSGAVKIAGFHNVYTTLDVVNHYQKTGEFLDGAVLVKELLDANSGRKTTGNLAWGGKITGWFVMVKDRKGRFPGNRLWGNGWGWSYFDAADSSNTTSTSFRSDCLGCHVPAQKDDWIFMDGYSLLKKEN